jgi:aromatic-L-amino-acid decarboxylase
MSSKSYHMPSEEFRRYGKQLIDWIADYYESIENLPVLSPLSPGDIRASLPAQAPAKGEDFGQILGDFEQLIMPGITHWQSPNFHAFFPANTSGPSILGELLSAGLGVQGMLWATSPACTELEMHVLDWLVDMLALPHEFKFTGSGGGVIQDSASSATLCALLAARERADPETNQRGGNGRIVVYASTQAHSSVEKAVGIAGLGRHQLRLISVDKNHAMRAEDLHAQMQRDRRAGLTPGFVCATLGTTASNAFDPLLELGEICAQEKAWLHVDAAMAGSAALCPEFRYLQTGLEFADSYCFNPHKWMFTNFDCDCFYVRRREDLIKALSIVPEYLRNTASETGSVVDYRDWQIPLGRRFRALKLWFVIRHYGIEGLQHHIRQHVALSAQFAQWVKDDPDFDLAAPAPLNLVCFRHRDGSDFNRALLEALNRSGAVYLSHAVLNGQYTLRFCIGQTQTQLKHVQKAWELIRSIASQLAASSR